MADACSKATWDAMMERVVDTYGHDMKGRLKKEREERQMSLHELLSRLGRNSADCVLDITGNTTMASHLRKLNLGSKRIHSLQKTKNTHHV